jgi:hypothetical protein
MPEEKLSFQAEVSRLLDIVANALYSNKEIFLRELISNASDACDRLRYLALTDPSLTASDPDLAIVLASDKKAATLTITDNGTGMSREWLPTRSPSRPARPGRTRVGGGSPKARENSPSPRAMRHRRAVRASRST